MRLKNRVKNTAKLKRDLTENAEELERLTAAVKQKKNKLQRSNKTLIEMEEELNEIEFIATYFGGFVAICTILAILWLNKMLRGGLHISKANR